MQTLRSTAVSITGRLTVVSTRSSVRRPQCPHSIAGSPCNRSAALAAWLLALTAAAATAGTALAAVSRRPLSISERL
jgi:hypothetical protein